VALLATCDPRVIIPNSLYVVVAMYSLSAFLNVLITGMIAVKLLLHRRFVVRNHVHTPGPGDVYVSAVGVLAESAAPYSASLIIFVILRASKNLNYKWFEGVMMAMSASPLRFSLRSQSCSCNPRSS
jgi:hypothetical protein